MPSPIGHVIGGLIIRDLAGERLSALEAAVVSILPDLDFIPGIIGDGRSGRYHGLHSHSIAGAVVVGVAVGWIRGDKHAPRWRRAVEGAIVYGSHLLLDALGKEQEDGMPLLWPLSQRRMAIRGSWFRTIERLDDADNLLESLLNESNLRAVVFEVATLLPIYAGVRIMARRRR